MARNLFSSGSLSCITNKLKFTNFRCAFIEILYHYQAHLDASNVHIEKFQELKPIWPPEPPVPAANLRDSPPKLQLHRPSNGSVTRFDSPVRVRFTDQSESLIPPPEPRRPLRPKSESPIPLPEFLIYLPESQFSTTEHPGHKLNLRPDGPLDFPPADGGGGAC